MEQYHKEIIDWIKNFFEDKPWAKAVVGISGGKDSTVCAALLVEALGKDRVVGVMMPNGEQKDISDSKRVCDLLGIERYTVDIGPAFVALSNAINIGKDLPSCSLYTTNTPARLRMTTLYGVAAAVGGLVCCTGNRSEDFIGYSTKYGDAAGDFALLNRLTKTEVVALGDYMKLPYDLIHKTPSDGMCGKTDEDNLGFDYFTLDNFILNGVVPESEEVWEKIKRMHDNPNTLYKLVEMPSALEHLPDAFDRIK